MNWWDFSPPNCRERPPVREATDDPQRQVPELADLVPDDYDQTYDMHQVIAAVVDHGHIFEIKGGYACNLITCFCRFDGQVVGLVASNPAVSGTLIQPGHLRQILPFSPGPGRLQYPPGHPGGHPAGTA